MEMSTKPKRLPLLSQHKTSINHAFDCDESTVSVYVFVFEIKLNLAPKRITENSMVGWATYIDNFLNERFCLTK